MKSRTYKKAVTTVHSVEIQRNGIGGRPFVSVEFDHVIEDNLTARLIAVMPIDAKSGECFVIMPSDLSQHWRGNYFFDEIKAIVGKIKG